MPSKRVIAASFSSFLAVWLHASIPFSGRAASSRAPNVGKREPCDQSAADPSTDRRNAPNVFSNGMATVLSLNRPYTVLNVSFSTYSNAGFISSGLRGFELMPSHAESRLPSPILAAGYSRRQLWDEVPQSQSASTSAAVGDKRLFVAFRRDDAQDRRNWSDSPSMSPLRTRRCRSLGNLDTCPSACGHNALFCVPPTR